MLTLSCGDTEKSIKKILSFRLKFLKCMYVYKIIQTKLKVLALITANPTVSKGHTDVTFHFVYCVQSAKENI